MSNTFVKKMRLKELDLENIFTRDLMSFYEKKCERYNLDEEELRLLGLISYYEKMPYEYVSEVGVFKAQHLKNKLDNKISPVLRLKITDYMIEHPDNKVFEIEKMDCWDFINMFGVFDVVDREESINLKEYLENALQLTMFIKDSGDGLLIGAKTIDGYTSEVRWDILPDYKDLFKDITTYFNEYVSLDFEECTDEDYQKLWKQFRDDLDYKSQTGKFRDNIPVEPKTKGTVVARLTAKGNAFLSWYNSYILPNRK